MKELELLQFIETHLQQNKRVVLMVVVESSGSSPGRQGFKMAVAEDETMFGSIGGGVMEVSLVKNSKFHIPNSTLIEQVHQKNSPGSSGMICSGKQTVVVKKLTESDLPTIQKITDCLKNRIETYLEITENSFQVTELTDFKQIYYFQKTGETSFIYREKLGYKNQLFIVGGGHCALALSELMSKLDFHITVFDDRPDLNTLQKNTFANRVEIIESYEKIGELIDSNESAYVVVMTLGYKFDEIVIRQLFDKNFKYFGVLGSKAKMKTLLKSLETEGFNKTGLAKIRTPIGLPINSHTPEEIAVSIAAEIISVKNICRLSASKLSKITE
jgi:xanthine dehydrogenase accessory factor